MPNIINPPASGTDNPNEVLHNVASFPVLVTYVYTLNDGTTTNTQSVTVTVNPRPRLSNTAPYPICSGAVFVFIPASSTLGYTYSWIRPFVPGIGVLPGSGTGNINEVLINNTFVPIAVTYVFTLTASGCSRVQNVVVTVNPVPAPITGDTSVCKASATALSNTAPGGTWMSLNPGIASVGPTDGIVTGGTVGTTLISYYLTGGCARSRGLTVLDCPNAVDSPPNPINGITIYPNPTNGIISLDVKSRGTLSLYTVDGRCLRTCDMTETTKSITLPAGLQGGIYFARFIGEDGGSSVTRVIYEP